MKKSLFLFLFMFLFFCFTVYSQVPLPVADGFVFGILEKTGLEHTLHYAKQVMEWTETANRFKQQVEHWKFQVERTWQNLKSAGDIRSYSDFMNWYNRQLYLERKTSEAFQNANIKIGSKNYSLYDLEGIAGAVDDTYIKYWDREFTEKQRKELWLGLGLTPSNYAYVQPFREKVRELSRESFFASDIQNEWYVRNMERNNERQERLAADKSKKEDEKMGEKEVMQLILESNMESNKVLNDISMMQARQLEMQAAQYYLDQAPYDAPVLSNWKADGFRPISNNSGY